MRPGDREHVATVASVLPDILVSAPGSYAELVPLYKVMLARLGEIGGPSVPLGAFKRILRSAGLWVENNHASSPRHQRVYGVRMR